MADNSNEKKTSFIKGVKAEFKKIIWPDKEDIKKHTVTVITVSLILGFIIAALDYVFQMGFGFIIK